MSDKNTAEEQNPSTIETDLFWLAKINNRFSGTDGDRMGAELIRKAMESHGFQTSVETFTVPFFWSYRLILNIAIFFLIYLLFRNILLISLSVYVFNMVMLWGELTFSFYAIDKFLFCHKSVNVEAAVNVAEPATKTIIVMAHHDSPRTGMIYTIAGHFIKWSSSLPSPFNRFFITPFAAALLLGLALVLQPVSGWTSAATVIGIVALALLGISALIILDIGWSKPSAGANDNGSGILVLMELGRRLAFNKPANAAVLLLATGAEEFGFFGIKDYLKRHKSALPAGTLFINLECVGGGDLHWATGEEHLAKIEYRRDSFDLISGLEKGELIPALPRKHIVAPTDAGAVKAEGLKVAILIGLENGFVPVNYHKKSDTFDKLDLKKLAHAADIVEALVRIG
jgi:hypothetical protein